MDEHNVLGAAVDIEHFQIIVKAMLAWSDESRAPKKAMARAGAPAGPRDEFDDDDDEAIVDQDDDEDEDDGEPAARAWPGAAASADDDADDEADDEADDAESPVSEGAG